MIGYVMLGTNDMPRAIAFYDALLGELGAKRFMETETFVIWGTRPDAPMLGVTKPYNGERATFGNGTMVALAIDSHAKIDALHKRALALGAADEGAAGPRGQGFYAGYFRDLDGNKLNFFKMG